MYSLKIKYTILAVLTAALLTGCSTKRNTATTRSLQALNTRFNVLYNGQTSYDEGIRNINQANTDDFSDIINMYAISKHDNANAAKTNMDRAIEKCRKAIKLHSIKKKPERKSSKWNDPAYKAWYNQNEFNPAMKDVWLLLAKAEFHKGDFLGSVGTFSYVARYYSNNTDMVDECQLWIARAYGEMGWLYEAEEVLQKIKQDKLRGVNTGLYAAVSADILLKEHRYKEAIPYLELALKNEKNKINKQRFQYLLGQLYEKNGNDTQAFTAFSNLIKQSPPYEMELSARINRASLNKNIPAVRKEVRRMIQNPNNKDYRDQLFYVLGMTYLNQGDTLKALENFRIAADTSSRNGYDKALALIKSGDLYYQKQKYFKAQPCYDEASKIITIDNDDYPRISRRAEALNDLASQNDIVQLQDSLQRLSALPQSKQREIVQAVIDRKIADEKAADEAEKRKSDGNRPASFDENFDMAPPIGMAPATGDWYFYNPSVIKSGSSDFRKKWGTRRLEDNWRRTTKSAALFADNNLAATNTVPNDTTGQKSAKADDQNSPEFYLVQIPKTAEQFSKSNEEIATALFNMGIIYKDRLEDEKMALKTFNEFERRFPSDKRTEETLYQSYIIETKAGNVASAETYKSKLTMQFPDSKYSKAVSQPDYLEKLKRMYDEQEKLYADTYSAFNSGNYSKVFENTKFMRETYPLSYLLPKFLFLNALSTGKTEKSDSFEKQLTEIITKYPSSDVSSMSKDMLALVKQGNETQKSNLHTSLLNKTIEEVPAETDANAAITYKFSPDKTGKHRLMLVIPTKKERINKLVYDIASFNFTRFMVKDFDIVSSRLDSTNTAISVTNFESYDEVLWYLSSIQNEKEIAAEVMMSDVARYIISDVNFGTMYSHLGLAAYVNFAKNNLNSSTPQANVAATKENEKIRGGAKTPAPKLNKPATSQLPEMVKADKIQQTESPVQIAATATPVAATQQEPTVVTKKETEPVKQATQPEVKPVEKTSVKPETATPTTAQPKPQQTSPVKVNDVLPPNVPLFKNLFGYIENEPHYIALYVLSGDFDFDKLKAGFDAFNKQNYGTLNLKVVKETFGSKQVIIIGAFPDAGSAKSYLYRIVDVDSLFVPLKSTDYRNLLGSQRNLNVVMQKNALDTYFEFMQQYYLK